MVHRVQFLYTFFVLNQCNDILEFGVVYSWVSSPHTRNIHSLPRPTFLCRTTWLLVWLQWGQYAFIIRTRELSIVNFWYTDPSILVQCVNLCRVETLGPVLFHRGFILPRGSCQHPEFLENSGKVHEGLTVFSDVVTTVRLIKVDLVMNCIWLVLVVNVECVVPTSCNFLQMTSREFTLNMSTLRSILREQMLMLPFL